MHIPADQDRTPSVPLYAHLSGETLNMLESLSTLSLTVCDQEVHTNIQVCGGMSLPLRAGRARVEGGVWGGQRS